MDVLRGGVNDLGGTLMEETISRMAGSENGSYKTIADLEALAHQAGRPARQRTTTYGEVPEERLRTAREHDGVWRPNLLPLVSGVAAGAVPSACAEGTGPGYSHQVLPVYASLLARIQPHLPLAALAP